MRPQSRPHNPFRLRRVWWTEPGLLLISFLYLGIGGGCIYWISFLEFPIAAQALGVLWIVVFPILIVMYKRVLLEPKIYVKQSVIRATKEALNTNRLKVRREFMKTELEQLEQGTKCVALDVWRIDPKLVQRHSYFERTRALYIDPQVRECHIRIQIAEEKTLNPKTVIQDVLRYLKIISCDGYLLAVGRYFDRLILVVDSVGIGDRGDEIPCTILSLLFSAQSLWKFRSFGILTEDHLKQHAELLFENGKEVVPHREIALPRLHGAK